MPHPHCHPTVTPHCLAFLLPRLAGRGPAIPCLPGIITLIRVIRLIGFILVEVTPCRVSLPQVFHFWEVCAGLTRLAVIKSTFPGAHTVEWAWDGATLPGGRARSQDLQQEEPPAPTRYLLEQKSDTTNPERHFLQEGGKELDLAPLPGTAGSSCSGCTVPTHLPGSSTWRLPLLSVTSRGGSGCPALTSTPWKVGVLQDTGGTGLQGWGRTGTAASAPREPGSHREKGQGWQSGDGTALEGRDTEPQDGRVFPALQRSEQEALGELREILAVVTFGTCVQNLNH